MDAVTQALAIFPDPTASLFPTGEAEASGGSLFGVLLAAFASDQASASTNDEAFAAQGISPPSSDDSESSPAFADTQWIAQIEAAPDFPKGRANAIQPPEAADQKTPAGTSTTAGSDEIAVAPTQPFLPNVEELDFARPTDANRPIEQRVPPSSNNTTGLSTGDGPISTSEHVSLAVENAGKPAPTDNPVGVAVPAEAFAHAGQAPAPDQPRHPHSDSANLENTPPRGQGRVAKHENVSQADAPDLAVTPPPIKTAGAPYVQVFTIEVAKGAGETVSAATASPDFILDASTPINSTAANGAFATGPSVVQAEPPVQTLDASNGSAGQDVDSSEAAADSAQLYGLAANAQSSRPAPAPPANGAAVNHAAVSFLFAQAAGANPSAVPPRPYGPAQNAQSDRPAPKLAASAAPQIHSSVNSPLADAKPADAPAAAAPLPEANAKSGDPAIDQTPSTIRAAPAAQESVQRQSANAPQVPTGAAPQAANIAQAPAVQFSVPDSANSMVFGVGSVAPDENGRALRAIDSRSQPQLALSLREDADSSLSALALRIAARSAGGDSRFTIRLDPPELGRIEVNLSVTSQGHAQAMLAVEKPQTLDLLQRDAPALERALRDAGLDLGGDLSFSLKGEGRPDAWRDDRGSARDRNIEIAAIEAANAKAVMIGASVLASPYYGAGPARLDITV